MVVSWFRTRLFRCLLLLALSVVVLDADRHRSAIADQPARIVRYEARLEVRPNGDIDCSENVQFPTQAYLAAKQQFGGSVQMFRAIQQTFGWSIVEDFQLEQDDVRSRINATFKHVGAARPTSRDRWVLEFINGAQMELLSVNDREVVLAGATESDFGVMSHTARLFLPPGSSDPRIIENGTALEYVYRPTVESGSAMSESFALDAREHLMSSLAAVHANREFSQFWTARSVFRNEGDQPLKNYRVRFRVANHSGWSEWSRTSNVYPGQTVVDPFFPVFDLDSIAGLSTSRYAMIEAEYEYQTPDGRTVNESDAKRVELLSRNQAVFSSRRSSETTTWLERNDNLPYVVSAFCSSDDPVVQQLAGHVSGMGNGLAASLDSKAAVQFLQMLWLFMQHNGIAYQTPPVLNVNQTFGQNIKYARDVLRNRAGTCIDLAIFWASVAKAVGLKAYVVAMPGHAFPVVQLPNGNQIPIESTMLGHGSLEQAVEAGLKVHQEATQGPHFLIDIQAIQDQGVRCLDLPNVSDSWLADMKYEFPKSHDVQLASYQDGASQHSQDRQMRGNPPTTDMVGVWETYYQWDGEERAFLFEVDATGHWISGFWKKTGSEWVKLEQESGRLIIVDGKLRFTPEEGESFVREYELSANEFRWYTRDESGNRAITWSFKKRL